MKKQLVLALVIFLLPYHTWAAMNTSLWEEVYNGYGTNTYQSGVWRLDPKASAQQDETHASLVISPQTLSRDWKIRVRMTPEKQLRSGTTPNPWETGWIVFGYKPDGTFKYLILKPNGYGVELGEYAGNGQNFLYTSSVGALDFPIGKTYDVMLQSNRGTISAYVNGARVMRYKMSVKDMLSTSGRLGWYTEDARVQFELMELRGR